MRCLRKQVHRKRGMSMVIALVFLLVCTMVGTIVITAATAGIGAVSNERADAQRTLALTSAAEYVSAELQELTYTASYIDKEIVTTTYVQGTDADGEITYTLDNTVNPNPDTSHTYSDVTAQMADSTLFASVDFSKLTKVGSTGNRDKNATVSYNFTFSVQGSQGESAYNIPDVSGKLTLDADYNATLILACDSDSMTLTFPSTVKESTKRAEKLSSDNTKSNPYTTTNDTANGMESVKTTETTHTTTVTWGAPTIEKGGSLS